MKKPAIPTVEPPVQVRVRARYELGGEVEADVRITADVFEFRLEGHRTWTEVPWNHVFAWVDAGLETSAMSNALQRMMRQGRKPRKIPK